MKPAPKVRRSRWRWAIAAPMTAMILLPARPAVAEPVNVTAANLAFAPADVPVQLIVGEPGYPSPHRHIVWTNTDPATEHTVTFENPRLTSSGPLAAGERHEVVVDAPGTFPYRCIIHPEMTGSLIVSPAPPAASAAPTRSPDASEPASGSSKSAAMPAAVGVAVAAGAVGVAWLILRRRRAGPAEP